MLGHSLKSELRKILTIRSYYLTLIIMSVLVLLPIPFVAGLYKDNPLPASDFLYAQYSLIGTISVVVMASLMVTGEYRHGEITSTFLTIPHRWVVMVSKFIIATALAVVVSIIINGLGSLLFMASGVDMGGASSSHGLKHFLLVTLGMIPVILVTQGLGWVLRSTALTTTLMIVLTMGFDNLLVLVPKVGDTIQSLLFMGNLSSLWNAEPAVPNHSVAYSALIVAIWVIVAVGAGVATVHKRDV